MTGSPWSKAFNSAFRASTPTKQDVLKDGVEQRYGSPVTDEWLEALLPEAWGHLITAAPCQKGKWVTLDDVPQEVLAVIAAALARMAANPGAYRNEQIGDYQYTYAGDVQAFFNDGEDKIIRAFSGCGKGGVYTVNVGQQYTVAPIDFPDMYPNGYTIEPASHANGWRARKVPK